ncbi:hypothetical protein GQR58_024378 [Nymphon striatum]|nr:hypothetical protein GQR58_024378 [Nymphon striatum]
MQECAHKRILKSMPPMQTIGIEHSRPFLDVMVHVSMINFNLGPIGRSGSREYFDRRQYMYDILLNKVVLVANTVFEPFAMLKVMEDFSMSKCHYYHILLCQHCATSSPYRQPTAIGLKGALQSCFFTIASTRTSFLATTTNQFETDFCCLRESAVLPVVCVAVYCALLPVDELSELVDALLSSQIKSTKFKGVLLLFRTSYELKAIDARKEKKKKKEDVPFRIRMLLLHLTTIMTLHSVWGIAVGFDLIVIGPRQVESGFFPFPTLIPIHTDIRSSINIDVPSNPNNVRVTKYEIDRRRETEKMTHV